MPENFERYLEEELLRTGDPDRAGVAVRVIFLRYRTRLSAYGLSLLSQNAEWCEDVLMDTMVRVFERKEQLLEQPSPVRWVFRSLYFVAKERLRQERRTESVDYGEVDQEPYADGYTDDGLRTDEYLTAIRKAMEVLAPQEQQVFERYYFGHQEGDIIASELGLASQTVNNLLSMARRKLWARLEELDQKQ